jgi:CBS-domain-containing membrane protein
MRRDFEAVDSHDMLEQAVQVLQRCGCRSLPVDHNGELVGMLTLENVGEFMMIRSAIRRGQNAVGAAIAQPELSPSSLPNHRKAP